MVILTDPAVETVIDDDMVLSVVIDDAVIEMETGEFPVNSAVSQNGFYGTYFPGGW